MSRDGTAARYVTPLLWGERRALSIRTLDCLQLVTVFAVERVTKKDVYKGHYKYGPGGQDSYV